MAGRSWLRPSRVATAAILVVAGLLFTASALTADGTDLRGDRASELRDLIARQAQRVGEAQARVEALARENARLADEQGGSAALAAERARVAALSPAAGVTEVVGPALTVVLNDAPRPAAGRTVPGDPSPDDLVVHQSDVQAVVNAMWRGGASAMRIMDQRIVSTSAVRCVGNTLILQGRVYSPPFRVTAVGAVASMRRALAADTYVGLFRQYAELYGLGYEEIDEGTVTLPAFTGSIVPRYAVPLEPEPTGVAEPSGSAAAGATPASSGGPSGAGGPSPQAPSGTNGSTSTVRVP